MDDINYFKDMLKSIQDYRKIVHLIFIIKQDNDLLLEMGLSDDFINKLYKGCKKILESEIKDYEGHVRNLEESILELTLNK